MRSSCLWNMWSSQLKVSISLSRMGGQDNEVVHWLVRPFWVLSLRLTRCGCCWTWSGGLGLILYIGTVSHKTGLQQGIPTLPVYRAMRRVYLVWESVSQEIIIRDSSCLCKKRQVSLRGSGLEGGGHVVWLAWCHLSEMGQFALSVYWVRRKDWGQLISLGHGTLLSQFLTLGVTTLVKPLYTSSIVPMLGTCCHLVCETPQ